MGTDLSGLVVGMTCEELVLAYNGASAGEWMDLRAACDGMGRVDLVEVCIAEATACYEADDAEAACEGGSVFGGHNEERGDG